MKDLILLNQVFCNLCVCKCTLTEEFCTKEKERKKEWMSAAREAERADAWHDEKTSAVRIRKETNL